MKFYYSKDFKNTIKALCIMCVALVFPIIMFFIIGLFNKNVNSEPILVVIVFLAIFLLIIPIFFLIKAYLNMNNDYENILITNQYFKITLMEIKANKKVEWSNVRNIEYTNNRIKIYLNNEKKPMQIFNQFDYPLDYIFEKLELARNSQLIVTSKDDGRIIENIAYQKSKSSYNNIIILLTFSLLIELFIIEFILKDKGFYWILGVTFILAIVAFIISAKFDFSSFISISFNEKEIKIEYVRSRNMRRKCIDHLIIKRDDILSFEYEDNKLRIRTLEKDYDFDNIKFNKTDRLRIERMKINR